MNKKQRQALTAAKRSEVQRDEERPVRKKLTNRSKYDADGNLKKA